MSSWQALGRSARLLLESLSGVAPAPFLVEWPPACTLCDVVPATLPVLRWLPDAVSQAPAGPLQELAQHLAAASERCGWRQTYSPSEVDASFLQRYGWCELVGPSGPISCQSLRCGFLLLGPQTLYPSHSHQAEELYVPLSGTAEWQQGAGAFVERDPGATILHRSWEPHATRTVTAPLLAMYLWRGAGLCERARLRS